MSQPVKYSSGFEYPCMTRPSRRWLVPTEIEAITPRVSAEDVWTPVPLIPEDSEEMEEQLLQRIALRLITKMAR